MWRRSRFCHAIGAERLLEDPKYKEEETRRKNRDALNTEIIGILKQRPSADWIDVLNRAGVPCGPIYSIDQVFADPQVHEIKMVQELTHPTAGTYRTLGSPWLFEDTPAAIQGPAPLLGQHTDAVLGEIGIAAGEIARLRANGVIA